jgi:hypothetical protein
MRDILVPSSANRYQPVQGQYQQTAARPILEAAAPIEAQWSMTLGREYPFILSPPPPKSLDTTSSRVTSNANGGAESLGLGANSPYNLPDLVKRVPSRVHPQQRFIVLQKWEGTVASANGDEFVAIICDLTDRSRPDEEATFPLEEVPESDRMLIVSGAVFYWNVGYELTPFGQRKRVSAIRFRRLPAWTRSEIESVRRRAESLKGLFGIHGESQATPTI